MNDQQNDDEYTNFGFKKVSFKNKKNLVNQVFSNVAGKYDIMNDLMSFGVHRLWKNKFCDHVDNLRSDILDVAGGTGDIALKLKAKARIRNIEDSQITICDINHEMLKHARSKAIDKNFINGLNYICGDAEKLPFASDSFDYYTIAFGMRNIPKIEEGLKEAYRVLKSGGKFLCLEFSKVEAEPIKQIYDFYSFNIIPKIGKLAANNEDAYKYLVESIELFPAQEEFANMIKQAGFQRVSYQNLTFGVAAIHIGYKL
jgi:demethylmenaquinone methyltransferase / 2-methoxy-6-polyprenyl-1,4-benzoquinol methylase